MANANNSSPAGVYRIVVVKNTLHTDNYVFNLVEEKLTVDVATAIDESKIDNGMHVFPNPSAGKLY